MKLHQILSRNLCLSGCFFVLSISSLHAGGDGWLTNFETAKKHAIEEKKDLLLEFTGSDWCPPCMKLSKEIFSQKSFIKASSAKFVLVELDFPMDKKLDAETTKQNDALQGKYKIEAYPTVLLCDAGGKPYAQTGFRSGGPEKYFSHLEELQGIRVKRDASFAKAEAAKENADKASALIEGLKFLEEEIIDSHYADVVERISKLDTEDKTGFVKAHMQAIAKKEAKAKVDADLEKFDTEMEPLFEAKEFDKIQAATKNFVKEHPDLPAEDVDQMLLWASLAAPTDQGDLKAANAIIDQHVKEFPDGYTAKNIDEAKAGIAEEIENEKNEN
jgi:thiol-disulfide isomerase/thioredoxin